MGQLKSNSIGRLKPGKYGDGGGLYLHVRDSGRRSWSFRFMRHGKARELGLGPYPAVSLPSARDKAVAMRQNLAAGRQVRTSGAITFEAVARAYIKTQSPAWHNAKHAAQWTATLEAYAYPVIGQTPVADVQTAHVLAVLAPIWAVKNETASRVRGRVEAVLDAARVQRLRPDGTNPAAWRGHLDKLLPKRSKTAPVRHHTALDFMAAKDLFHQLAGVEGEAARALRFLILTAARTGEVLGATWPEIDGGSWTIPAARMKAGRAHRVPLAPAALAVLGPRGAGYLFGNHAKPLSNMAMAMCLRRAGCEATVHGFRSTFRDWAATETNAAREVAEMALAHGTRDKTEAAYLRSDLFAKRRGLMELWATMLTV